MPRGGISGKMQQVDYEELPKESLENGNGAKLDPTTGKTIAEKEFIKEGLKKYKGACNQQGEISNVVRNHVHLLVFARHLIILKENWGGYRFFKTAKECKTYVEQKKKEEARQKREEKAEAEKNKNKEGPKDQKEEWLEQAAALVSWEKPFERKQGLAPHEVRWSCEEQGKRPAMLKLCLKVHSTLCYCDHSPAPGNTRDGD